MIEYIESEPSSQTPRNINPKHAKRQQRTPTRAQSRAKIALMRSKSKQNFLTDPQTSDHTQKSTSSAKIRIQILQEKIHKLHKENSQLRQQIITMKANQFYTINQEKVKMAIQENEKLRQEISQMRKINEQLEIQNQFLQRNNKLYKGQLQELTNTNLRQSVDASKSRMRQNTTRTINNPGQAQMNNPGQAQNQKITGQAQQNIATIKPHQYSATKNQKKTMEHVKSNPNLVKYRMEEDSDFVAKQRDSYKHAQRQIRNKKYQNDPLSSSNQHFLRQFQKYQKQLTYNSSSNKKTLNKMYSSRGDTDFRQESNETYERQLQTIKMPIKSKQSRNGRSKSKESSLQAILNRKKQLMNRKDRNDQDTNNYGIRDRDAHNDRHNKRDIHNDRHNERHNGRHRDNNNERDMNDKNRDGGQNEQNCMGRGNGVSRQIFNQQYLIGKNTKYSSPNNHRIKNIPFSPNPRITHEYDSSKRTYRG